MYRDGCVCMRHGVGDEITLLPTSQTYTLFMAQTFVGARSEYLSQIHHTAFISSWLTESWYSTDPWYQALVVIATGLDCSRVGLRESFLLMATSARVRSPGGLRERASR